MTQEIKGLTGVRGLAALYVALYHFHFSNPVAAQQANSFLGHGYIAVDLFFSLSGFVMALTYGRWFTDGYSVEAHKDFLLRRVARIYPLYLLMTLAVVMASWLGLSARGDITTVKALSNLLMIQAWGITNSLLGPAWSISVEWAVYLLFPALVLLILRGGHWRTVVAIAACVGVLGLLCSSDTWWMLGGQTSRHGPLDLYMGDSVGPLLRCVAGFSLGLAAYRLKDIRWIRKLGSSSPCQLAAAAVLVLLLQQYGNDVALALMFPIMIVMLYCNRGPLSAFMGSRPIHLLGTWSYSLYLIHTKFEKLNHYLYGKLDAAGVPLVELFASAMTLLCAIAVSALLYRFVEKPCRIRFQHWLTGPRALSGAAGRLAG